MSDEHAGFASARARLEDIATQVRDKDTPLEKCLDLLEEGVRIANRCTELLDHTEWRSAVEGEDAEGAEGAEGSEGEAEAAADEGDEADEAGEPSEEAPEEAPEAG